MLPEQSLMMMCIVLMMGRSIRNKCPIRSYPVSIMHCFPLGFYHKGIIYVGKSHVTDVDLAFFFNYGKEMADVLQ